MREETGSYKGYDGTEMFLRTFHPDKAPRAVILGIHGLGNHSGLLAYVGRFFAGKGFVFVAPDMRGFGHYSGRKGHVERFDEYTSDLHTLFKSTQERFPGLKMFMYGHSMGGLHIVRYAIAHPEGLTGILIPCPSVSERLKVSKGTRAIAALLSRLNVKTYVSDGIDLTYIARNPEVVKRNQEDPLRFDRVTPRMAVEGLGAKDKAFASAHLLNVPVLVQQTGDDLILVPEKNKDFYDRIASKDKTWKLYEGLYHEPFEDEGGGVVLADMLAWIEAKL